MTFVDKIALITVSIAGVSSLVASVKWLIFTSSQITAYATRIDARTLLIENSLADIKKDLDEDRRLLMSLDARVRMLEEIVLTKEKS